MLEIVDLKTSAKVLHFFDICKRLGKTCKRLGKKNADREGKGSEPNFLKRNVFSDYFCKNICICEIFVVTLHPN